MYYPMFRNAVFELKAVFPFYTEKFFSRTKGKGSAKKLRNSIDMYQ